MGEVAAILILDKSGYVNKSEGSAGVGRKYCGSFGKAENCQVGVFTAYASPHDYMLLDAELYGSEAWFDESRGIKGKVQIPRRIDFHN